MKTKTARQTRSKPVYPIDYTRRAQVERNGQTFIVYGGVLPDCISITEAEPLPRGYKSDGKVALCDLQPPSETEHYNLDLQGKL